MVEVSILFISTNCFCLPVGGGTPRHRLHEQVVKELPTHVCTMSPEAIREEVEMLKTDFNGRVTQILFNSMLCAYYMGCVPLCFAQVSLVCVWDKQIKSRVTTISWGMTGWQSQCFFVKKIDAGTQKIGACTRLR